MQKLSITNLGPITACEIDMKDFTVLTGAQASGKSTIAKSIFFFSNLKNILFSMYQKQMAVKPLFEGGALEDLFAREVNKTFIQAFGIENHVVEYGGVIYEYDNACTIMVSYEPSEDGASVTVTFDDAFKHKLELLSQLLDTDERKNPEKIRQFINEEVFALDMDAVYIPAGRSMPAVLSSQINYLYSVMDDRIRAMIDFCTQQFIENVLLLKDYFNRSYDSILKHTLETVDYEIDEAGARMATEMIRDILGGEYRVVNGEERFYFDSQNYVKINHASSGQQEAVWIVNMLFYYMLGKRKTFFIIEEPESHLFPETQKAMVELISLVKNGSNKVLITTHSPYVLGSVNNLLYANHIANSINDSKIEAIVPRRLWIEFKTLSAYYIENGKVKDITNSEYQDMDHDVIDGVSGVLNETYERLVDIARED